MLPILSLLTLVGGVSSAGLILGYAALASSAGFVGVSAQTSTNIFSDNFDDNSRDATKWSLGVLSQPSNYFDSAVAVQERNQRLEITPRAGQKNQHFNGYVSVSSFNLTNAQATVEAFDKGVLLRLARRDVVPFDAALL